MAEASIVWLVGSVLWGVWRAAKVFMNRYKLYQCFVPLPVPIIPCPLLMTPACLVPGHFLSSTVGHMVGFVGLGSAWTVCSLER